MVVKKPGSNSGLQSTQQLYLNLMMHYCRVGTIERVTKGSPRALILPDVKWNCGSDTELDKSAIEGVLLSSHSDE